MSNKRIHQSSLVNFFLTHCLKLFVTLGLLFWLVYKVFDCVAVEDLPHTEDFIKIFFEFLSSFFDVFRALVRDTEDFLFGENRSKLKQFFTDFLFCFPQGHHGHFWVHCILFWRSIPRDCWDLWAGRNKLRHLLQEYIWVTITVPIDADLHVYFVRLFWADDFLFFVRDEIFLHHIEAVYFFNS